MKLGKTQPYVPKAIANDRTMLPMVMYAKSIGKNTAEFTQHDLRKFLRWLWQREPCKNKLWVPSTTAYFGNGQRSLSKSEQRRLAKQQSNDDGSRQQQRNCRRQS